MRVKPGQRLHGGLREQQRNRNRNGDSDRNRQLYRKQDGRNSELAIITNETKFTITCPALTDGTQYVYDGSAFEPEVTVTRIEGNKKLVKDSNHSVTYTDNIHAGTATVSVEGLGGYVGVWQKTPCDCTEILRTAA